MFDARDANIRYVGRVDTRDPVAARFAWPAAGFTFGFRGTSLTLALEDTPLPDRTEENDWLDIRIDGERVAPIALTSGRHEYRVATGLGRGRHEVQVAKRTEAEVGTVGLAQITLDRDAILEPARPLPQRVIELVGDSISTGFGIEGANADCPFSAATEDATRSYGALAARALDAEVWIVAWKGKGVLRNNDLAEPDPLPALYGRLIPGEATSPTYTYARHPDVVVLNLGTNDYALSAPPSADFAAAYGAFVDRLRALHPRALLVLAVGPMLFDEGAINYRTLVRNAITTIIAARRARGDSRVASLELWTDPADGVACQFHPNLVTHQRMADELVRLIDSELDW